MEIFQPDRKQLTEREHGTRQRIVVKLGSSTVCDERGAVRTDLLHSFASQSLDLQRKGIDTIFVSSGAVAAGRFVLPGCEDRKLLADIGQPLLSLSWIKAYYPRPVAQRLFTDEELVDTAYLRDSIETALRAGAIPIINSSNPGTNNDYTGRQVAHAIDADILAMLTTTDGVLHKGQTISHVRSRSDLDGVGFGDVSPLGLGGMGIKSDHAIRFMEGTGKSAIIAHGLTDAVLHKIAGRERIGTLFAQV